MEDQRTLWNSLEHPPYSRKRESIPWLISQEKPVFLRKLRERTAPGSGVGRHSAIEPAEPGGQGPNRTCRTGGRRASAWAPAVAPLGKSDYAY